jgi:hypothetical protein
MSLSSETIEAVNQDQTDHVIQEETQFIVEPSAPPEGLMLLLESIQVNSAQDVGSEAETRFDFNVSTQTFSHTDSSVNEDGDFLIVHRASTFEDDLIGDDDLSVAITRPSPEDPFDHSFVTSTITVDAANPAAAEDRVDNRPNDGVINVSDRNVTLLNLDQMDGPDSMRLDFDGNTLTVFGLTSLTVNEDILFV